jgi:Ca2+-binding EF-hand superfamily protein
MKEFCKFCQETEKELWTLFTSIDKDNNGRLDKHELASAFERSGVGVSNARLDRFFSHIDKDRDGLIDYNEWRGSSPDISKDTTKRPEQHTYNAQIFFCSSQPRHLVSTLSYHTTNRPHNSQQRET